MNRTEAIELIKQIDDAKWSLDKLRNILKDEHKIMELDLGERDASF